MNRIALALVIFCLNFTYVSCNGKKPVPPTEKAPPHKWVANPDAPDGVVWRVTEGENVRRSIPILAAAAASPLSTKRTQALLSRLSPINTQSTDKTDFALRERSLPAPRTGDTIPMDLSTSSITPPPVTSKADRGPLTVLRYSPEGNVPLAPKISITFSQPMVAVTSHTDASSYHPAVISPQTPGQWRWIGTKTLLFDPKVRLPQATNYKVTINRDTKSTLGNTLQKDVSFRFQTPPPQMKDSWPRALNAHTSTVMFAAFDQQIDPAAILPTIKVTAGGKPHSVRLATDEEIANTKQVQSRITSLQAVGRNHTTTSPPANTSNRYIAFVATAPFPKDTPITVTFPQGTASVEGPVTTKKDQSFHFQTYPPLKVKGSHCGSSRWSKCNPRSNWWIRFNNPLDEKNFDPKSIVIEPALPDPKIWVSHNSLYINGTPEANSRYTVTIPASLRDTFDQTLGKQEEVDFHIGDHSPSLFGPNGIVTLDPFADRPTYDVFVTKHKHLQVKLYQVQPKDFPNYIRHTRDSYDRKKQNYKTPPGTLVYNKRIAVPRSNKQLTKVPIDLSAVLNNDLGHVIVDIRPGHRNKGNPWPPRVLTWVQSTRIGLHAASDSRDLHVWASQLTSGQPTKNISVALWGASKKASAPLTGATNMEGFTKLALEQVPPDFSWHHPPSYLVATRGADTALLAENTYSGSRSWYRQYNNTQYVWHVFDDRKVYKPGETVSLKGWLRAIDYGKDLRLTKDDTVTYFVRGPRGNKLHEGKTTLSNVGGFDFTFDLPTTPNLGHASVLLSYRGKSNQHSFQIQEFRTPEYEVTTTPSDGPYLVGQKASVELSAKYFAGGGLAGADLRWNLRTQQGNFAPPNWDKFRFGTSRPWWFHSYNPKDPLAKAENLQAKTNAAGKHTIDVSIDSITPPQPVLVTATGSVTDINRQTWSGSTSLLVHPSNYYIGMRSQKYFYKKDEPIKIEAIAVTQEGTPVVNTPLHLTLVRLDWTYQEGEYKQVEKDPQECKKVSQKEKVTCSFDVSKGGRYQITGHITDKTGRSNRTIISTWVAGGELPKTQKVSLEEAQIIPDKQHYKPGDTAKLLVRTPFFPATGVLTTRRAGMVSTQMFTLDSASKTLEVAIQDLHTPNIHVQVDIVGQTNRITAQGKPLDAQRPAHATATINLSIPPKHRELDVKVIPKHKRLDPGKKTTLEVSVTKNGKPVADTEVAVLVVDEAVWSLSDYKISSPIEQFYFKRSQGVRDRRSRDTILLSEPARHAGNKSGKQEREDGESKDKLDDVMAMAESDGATSNLRFKKDSSPVPPSTMQKRAAGEMSLAANGSGPSQKTIAIRSDFNALAHFAPRVRTDSAGKATIPITMPDNLTRYRVVAVAAADAKFFGKGESSITARLPLMVRPSPPRFLNFGDSFEMPIVLQNQTDKVISTEVAIQATNATILGTQGKKIRIPANDRVEVRFPVRTQFAGTARFQFVATSRAGEDAADAVIPVWPPATTEAFATYGQIDKGAIRQMVSVPTDAVTQFGGLEVTTSSTQLQALTDAFLYLVDYPFECTEQKSSRILSIVALQDVLSAFARDKIPSKEKLQRFVERDIKALVNLQNGNGGFAFWRKGHKSWPFVSLHVLHAFSRAKTKGYAVPHNALERALRYAKDIERYINDIHSEEVRRAIIAYSLYVRNLAGDTDLKKAQSLLSRLDLKKANLEMIGWLYNVFANQKSGSRQANNIYRALLNRLSETAGAANFVSSYSDGQHLILHSARRADGILLEALITHKSKSDIIPKLVRGLLAHRKQGRWGNTQENVFILLALDKYFKKYEGVTPNFVAKLWLGGKFAGSHAFRGRTTERSQLDVPMNYLAKNSVSDVVIQKAGKGRLYYRVGMTYAPKSLALNATDHGFAIARKYEAVDKPSDVKRNSDGSWSIKAGARVKISLEMAAESRRYHVALVDPLPAGLEVLNPSLTVTEDLPQDTNATRGQTKNRYWWWSRPWYEHQNMRDDRVEAFASLLRADVHQYSYYARATTPGTFIVPPTKAEEMYMPETFGRSASDIVKITP